MKIETKFNFGDKVQSNIFERRVVGVVGGFAVKRNEIIVQVWHLLTTDKVVVTGFYEDEIEAAPVGVS